MPASRRTLAAFAFALMVVQCLLSFTPALAACCGGRLNGHIKAQAAAEDVDCCPPGSHPPGQCPRHKTKALSSSESSCRMQCAAADARDLVLLAVGTIVAPAAGVAPAPARRYTPSIRSMAIARAARPDAPPPKSL